MSLHRSILPMKRAFARLAPLSLLALAACQAPRPTDTTVEFQTERGIVRGVSTEDGILALVDIVPETGELSFRYRTGRGFFDDVARLDRKNDALAVMKPVSSQLELARFAAYPAAREETLYLEVRASHRPELLRCELFDEGRRGDLLVPKDGRAADLVTSCAGAGVYAWRNGEMELVGVLNGVWCEELEALAFIGLDEIADVLPKESSFFARRALPKRADFEYGIPRDFAGEKAYASDLRKPEPPPTTTPAATTTPAEPPKGVN